MIDFEKLRAPFPPEAISWRIGVVSGNKGLPLAYINARDLMDRLDEAVGPENWQCRYSHADMAKTICEIGIKCGDEWVWKADGAGDTDVEEEKGALSDALKRAGVRWGIARYLYSVKAPWINLDVSDPKRPKIPQHELERLMGLLPNGGGGVTVSAMSGQPKSPGKFWANASYSVIPKVPKEYCDQHGDVRWEDPEAMARVCSIIHRHIDAAPHRLALTKLQSDNLPWVVTRLTPEDKEDITQAFVIRASQFTDGEKHGKS